MSSPAVPAPPAAAPCPGWDRRTPWRVLAARGKGLWQDPLWAPPAPSPVSLGPAGEHSTVLPPVPFSLMVKLFMGLSRGSFPLGMLLFL